ncbi:Two-component system regulatory protein [Azospirillum doebereinerae]
MSRDALLGKRVIVVEDELLVSLMLENMLSDLGCEVAGTTSRVEKALTLVSGGSFELAVLDVNIAGEMVYPVAEALPKRGISFVFPTGYGLAGLDDTWKDRPVLQKPFQERDFTRALTSALVFEN